MGSFDDARIDLSPVPSIGFTPLGTLPPPLSLSAIQLSNLPPAGTVLATGSAATLSAPSSSTDNRYLARVPDWLMPITSEDSGLSLSMSLRPVPARMVQQIRAGRYIDMRDLLWDNSSVRCHYEGLQGGLGINFLPGSSRPRIREIPSLPAWVCCFLTYLAVQTSDQATRERATYGLLVVREAMRHGGRGWMDYDRLFRQQAELNSGLRWNVIHPELQATTVLAHRDPGTGLFCLVCQECDHVAHQCALAQLQQPSTRPTLSSPHPASRNYGRICASWNEGACIFPGSCNYRHICSVCFHHTHRARDCRSSARPRQGTPQGRSGAHPSRSTQAPSSTR